MYTVTNIYKDYNKENTRVDKELFINICADFNILVFEELLEGSIFNMGNNLSTLSIVRKERDPRSPRIDWGESNKYKQELLEELIYVLKTDDLAYLKFKKQ